MGVLKQNLAEQAEFADIFRIQLLFEACRQRPESIALAQALSQAFGDVEQVADVEGSLTTYALLDYPVTYADNQKMPAQVLMANFAPFDSSQLDEMMLSQLWDCPNGEDLLKRCTHQLMISDFLAAGLDYPLRCQMLTRWLETALGLFEDCVPVGVPAGGTLFSSEQVLHNPMSDGDRFIYWAVNVRFFQVDGSADKVIDTLGLYAIGLPDIQYHFRGLDPDAVVTHAYSTASYVFANNAPIASGETINGLKAGNIDSSVWWRCQYEMALIQPSREVMDVCPQGYAAGGRQ